MEQQEMDRVMQKAEVLIEALPYIRKFNRKNGCKRDCFGCKKKS